LGCRIARSTAQWKLIDQGEGAMQPISHDPFDLLCLYEQRGWAVIPVNAGEKRATVKGWNIRKFELGDFDPSGNIGMRFGTDSGGLVDLDLDCTEAIDLAPIYLPPTGARFGRRSKPLSHRLYVAPGLTFETFHDPVCHPKNTLLEIRSNGATGGAHQTIVPPSIADGERREWYRDVIEPALIDARVLRHRVAWLATGCLVMRYLGESTARRPAPDFPQLLWEFDHDLARPVYDWFGLQAPDAPQRYPRPRHQQDPRDLDLAEIVAAIPNDYDWNGWNDIGLAIFAASRDRGDAFAIFDHFSAKSPKYDPYETRARWKNYERYPPNRTGIGKLAALARRFDWRPSGTAA